VFRTRRNSRVAVHRNTGRVLHPSLSRGPTRSIQTGDRRKDRSGSVVIRLAGSGPIDAGPASTSSKTVMILRHLVSTTVFEPKSPRRPTAMPASSSPASRLPVTPPGIARAFDIGGEVGIESPPRLNGQVSALGPEITEQRSTRSALGGASATLRTERPLGSVSITVTFAGRRIVSPVQRTPQIPNRIRQVLVTRHEVALGRRLGAPPSPHPPRSRTSNARAGSSRERTERPTRRGEANVLVSPRNVITDPPRVRGVADRTPVPETARRSPVFKTWAAGTDLRTIDVDKPVRVRLSLRIKLVARVAESGRASIHLPTVRSGFPPTASRHSGSNPPVARRPY